MKKLMNKNMRGGRKEGINIYIYKMKIIPTWPRVSLPRFHQTALQNRSGEVGWDKKNSSPTQKLAYKKNFIREIDNFFPFFYVK